MDLGTNSIEKLTNNIRRPVTHLIFDVEILILANSLTLLTWTVNNIIWRSKTGIDLALTPCNKWIFGQTQPQNLAYEVMIPQNNTRSPFSRLISDVGLLTEVNSKWLLRKSSYHYIKNWENCYCPVSPKVCIS